MTLDASAAQRARGASVDGGVLESGQDVDVQANPLARLSSLLLRAQLLCVFGGARLGLKTTRRIGRSQLRILDHLTAPEIRSADSEQVLRTVIDDVRGCLRMIAEDASVEVARLSAEMGKLDARARGLGIDGSNSLQAYHRRWKVKP